MIDVFDIIEVFDTIGFYGPIILFFIVIYYLWKRNTYLIVYILSFGINMYINKFLKIIFRQARPENPIPFSKLEKYKNEEQFGMPSGHAQSVFFSLVYLYQLNHSFTILISNLFIAVLTLYQRAKYRRHTLEQLAWGSIVGTLFAWTTVFFVEKIYQ